MGGWLRDWLTEWLTEWLTDWLSDEAVTRDAYASKKVQKAVWKFFIGRLEGLFVGKPGHVWQSANVIKILVWSPHFLSGLRFTVLIWNSKEEWAMDKISLGRIRTIFTRTSDTWCDIEPYSEARHFRRVGILRHLTQQVCSDDKTLTFSDCPGIRHKSNKIVQL